MKKVAIIGAGASGIVCAKKFIDAGFKVIVFEKSNNTAGVWNYGDTGVIYSSLKTNLPRQIMVFEDEVVAYNCNEPFPDYSAVRNYLANNSKAWSVDEVIRFSCEVTKITPINTDDRGVLQRCVNCERHAYYNKLVREVGDLITYHNSYVIRMDEKIDELHYLMGKMKEKI